MNPNSTEIACEFPYCLRIYKDGHVERLMGNETTPPGTDPDTGVQSKDITISSETGVSARLFLPKTINPKQKLKLLIYIHGGAFCVASPFNPAYHNHVTTLAAKANVIALSVKYRLAPEHPLPIAYEDTWTAFQWVALHVNRNGPEAWLNDHADFEHVFFAGDSAGANLAHNMAMQAAAEGLSGMKLDGILLIHPYFRNNEPDICNKVMEYLYPTGMDDPRINAIIDPKLSSLGCSRVVVFVAEKDFIRDRGIAYYEALKNSGWSGVVELVDTEDEEHDFHLFHIVTGKIEVQSIHNQKAVALVNKMVSFMTQS
ncbi:Alpha/beta hydrolase fold protein [Quillaja saponaria]|uniref:Alpha/beta hydrolase fold protein n=1 Tax=Quillaja saponaria TaxID=32244 RepID=A0AAD7LK32_QUISA|nr:Alpha/beta hydrolase fold protein [Quillaja saponaria]